MNISPLVFRGNPCLNVASVKVGKPESAATNMSDEIVQSTSNVNSENYKANFMPSFKGNIKVEESKASQIGTLNHQTAFFREPETDEIVQNYIFEKFGDDDEINVVSGACSTGEEAKSYAMMLDSLGDKLNIYGFDISDDAVKGAKGNEYQLVKKEEELPGSPVASAANLAQLQSENILFDDTPSGLSKYQTKCRDKFNEYFVSNGSEYKVPLFPTAKQELADLQAIVDDEEKLAANKKEYEEQVRILKEANPQIAKYLDSVSYEDSIETAINVLKDKINMYQSVKDFTEKDHVFDSCTFARGDVMNLGKLYKPNSVNVLLYRNALYHSLCAGDNMLRFMNENAEDTMDIIAKQMNGVVKKDGLVVFGEREILQGIDVNVVERVMQNNGFELLEGTENVWVKIDDVE